ncbi:MHYT domain-containing protein [Streptomyces sp. NPDC026665]|uniref:MHYT domain-containing protein n=1 Tax=Streptomyces sp. NPDC026665 TaxID=3154798 RepID=UPI0034084889
MTATVTDFHYGAVTPIVAYLMACVGAALGLRCTTRSLRRVRRRTGWLSLGAVSIGCGIWTMHFIAMAGFSVDGATVGYDPMYTLLSLIVAIVVVAIGLFWVGFRGGSTVNLAVAGVFTGLGVAAMHYLGMAAIRTHGIIHYNVWTVFLSVLIAVLAATAALWAAVSINGVWWSLGASIVMGVAVTGMHYTGMAAVSVHVMNGVSAPGTSTSTLAFPLLMLAGPLVALLIASAIVMFDPDMMLGEGEWVQQTPTAGRAPAPIHQPVQSGQSYTSW